MKWNGSKPAVAARVVAAVTLLGLLGMCLIAAAARRPAPAHKGHGIIFSKKPDKHIAVILVQGLPGGDFDVDTVPVHLRKKSHDELVFIFDPDPSTTYLWARAEFGKDSPFAGQTFDFLKSPRRTGPLRPDCNGLGKHYDYKLDIQPSNGERIQKIIDPGVIVDD